MTISADARNRLKYALTNEAAANELLAILDFLAQTADGTGMVLSKLLIEPAASGIIAFAGGGQAGATQLVAEINSVGTVATALDSVKLPAAVAGLTIMVINATTKAMQVFGLGADTVDAAAAATGVTHMANSVVLYVCAAAGAWQTEGLATGFAGSFQTFSNKDAITAFATGGQANAVVLTSMINRISVCATAGDSVKLPVSAPGLELVVINDGATSANVFPQTGDTINGLAANSSFPVPAGSTVVFKCLTAGAWHSSPGTILQQSKFTLDATAGPLVAVAGELTGANDVVAQYSGIAGSTLTTRSAAQMIADGGYKVGQSYRLRIVNSNGGTLTFTAGGNVTITGHAAILTNTWVDYVVTITAAGMTFQSVGAGTQP